MKMLKISRRNAASRQIPPTDFLIIAYKEPPPILFHKPYTEYPLIYHTSDELSDILIRKICQTHTPYI